jgi:hypothetical protein
MMKFAGRITMIDAEQTKPTPITRRLWVVQADDMSLHIYARHGRRQPPGKHQRLSTMMTWV